MLDVILRILTLLGIIFLILLALTMASALLILFFPITYRALGSRDADFQLSVKARWLFGLLRARYQYPEPGRIIVKALCFTLHDSKFPAEKEEEEEHASKKSIGGNDKPATGGAGDAQEAKGGNAGSEAAKDGNEERAGSERSGMAAESGEDKNAADGRKHIDTEENACVEGGTNPENGSEEGIDANHPSGKFFSKIEKIKYTIHGICDKIKKIWENISYYIELLQEEDTKRLFDHALLRIGEVLRNIRPRHIKARILFGTGSPDTTGYAYGVYCMLAPVLKCDGTWVVPDFENAVFQGEIQVSGHITLWVLLINVLKLVLDRRMRRFVKRIKAGKKDSVQELGNGGKNGR